MRLTNGGPKRRAHLRAGMLLAGIAFAGFGVSAQGEEQEVAAGTVNREELRQAMLEYFGPGPAAEEAVEPDLAITEKTDQGDHERWRMEYNVHADDRATGYLLIPKPVPETGKKLPLILALHPTSLIGKDRVIGKYAEPASSDSERRDREARQYALDLVRRGFLVFAPDRAGFGERRLLGDPKASVTRQMDAYREFLKERWPGWRLTAGKNVWDLQRALDFLTKMEFVDADRIAAIGHSLGSWDSIMIAAMDDRVKALVANSGGMVEFKEDLWRDPDALRAFLADPERQSLRPNANIFLMLIAPRPMLYLWSLDDPYEKGKPNVLEGMRAIHKYYESQYTGKNPWFRPPFSIYFHGHGHNFPPEARMLAYRWLEDQFAGE